MGEDAKVALRKAILAQRDCLPAHLRIHHSEHIRHVILTRPEYRTAKVVLGYMSFGSEFQTQRLMQSVLADGKMLVLPKVNRAARKLDLYRVHDLEQDLHAGHWGIPEPRAERCTAITPQQIDLMLMPGVAFDRKGERLGYGGGYYDRLLHSLPRHPVLIAPAYSLQVVERIPTEFHDRPVDLVVTENGLHGRLAAGTHSVEVV